jgi:hypothetical protein
MPRAALRLAVWVDKICSGRDEYESTRPARVPELEVTFFVMRTARRNDYVDSPLGIVSNVTVLLVREIIA